ncbi:MAG: lipid-binding SYLF domain-containing protein [Acetobacteraceae bacterium]|jgi:lipid-binding SYLF domain-containing protein
MLLTLTRLLAAVVLAITLLAAPAAHARSGTQVTIDGARKTLADLRHDKAFGTAAHAMHQARAVLIVPRLIKGGFMVGGEGGNGVLMLQARDGTWSNPAFYAIGAASFGLQAGLEQSELVLLVMTQKGLDGLLHDHFKIGAQAGIAVATLGSGVEAAISGPTPPDIIVWSSSTGVYGGLTIDGSIIRQEPNDDSAWYGRPITTRDILFGRLDFPRAAALRRELGSIG